MFEESIESFIMQWKPYAATVQLFPHTEGSPLLECSAAGCIFHVFERTGPYHVLSGTASLIINPVTERVTRADTPGKQIEVIGVSRLRVKGLVLLNRNDMVVVDAGVPLVVGVFAGTGDVALGDWLEFESVAPVHGFLLPVVRSGAVLPASGDSI